MSMTTCDRWILPIVLMGMSACGAQVRSDNEASAQPAELRYVLSPDVEAGAWHVRVEMPRLRARQPVCPPPMGTRLGESFEWRGAWRGEEALAVEWQAGGCFRVEGQDQGPFELRYNVAVVPGERRAWRAISLSPQASSAGLIFPGETLFVELSQRGFDWGVRYRVEVEVPEGYALISTLPWDAESEAFLVDQLEDLTRSVVWLAPHEQVEEALEGRVRLALDPRMRPPLEARGMAQAASCLWTEFGHWVGTRRLGPVAVLVLGAQWDVGAEGGFARRHGVVLQVGRAAAERSEAMSDLLAHELFHRFNGESLRFEPSSYEETTWFREGVTSYVAAVAVVQAGLSGERSFLDSLAGYATSYVSNPDLQRLPYDRGVLLSLALDMILRDISANERSLQGFFRFLASSSWWEELQDNSSLEHALSHYAGADLSEFFRKYVEGGEAIPVYALLSNSGFAIERGHREVPDFGMDVVYDLDRVELRVREVREGSVAWTAGVRSGDIMRPLAGTRFDSLEVPAEFEVQRGAERSFVRLEPKRRKVVALKLGPRGADAERYRAVLEVRGEPRRCGDEETASK